MKQFINLWLEGVIMRNQYFSITSIPQPFDILIQNVSAAVHVIHFKWFLDLFLIRSHTVRSAF